MKNIALFASGNGSNAKKIIQYFKNHLKITIALVISNNSNAGVLQIAKDNNIPTAIVNRRSLLDKLEVLDMLQLYKIDFIALAGFMVLIPVYLAEAFPNRIVNIHPALLPKYGGKGMYGMHVHEAVFHNHEKESGITIHFVNAHYDEGQIVFQEKVNIEACKSADEIAEAVLRCEHANFAKVIEKVVNEL